MSDPQRMFVSVFVIACFVAILFFKRRSLKVSFYFLTSLAIALFILSTFYKDSFWAYYFEGIQYLYLLLIAIILSINIERFAKPLWYAKVLFFVILLCFGLQKYTSYATGKLVYDGIKVQQDIVKYVQQTEKDTQHYCVRVYTPPVIPYTYDYLFLYQKIAYNIPQPTKEWSNKRCWFIIEYDSYTFRKDKWLVENLPQEGSLASEKRIKDVDIQLWVTK
jgi:hypothetical protein